MQSDLIMHSARRSRRLNFLVETTFSTFRLSGKIVKTFRENMGQTTVFLFGEKLIILLFYNFWIYWIGKMGYVLLLLFLLKYCVRWYQKIVTRLIGLIFVSKYRNTFVEICVILVLKKIDWNYINCHIITWKVESLSVDIDFKLQKLVTWNIELQTLNFKLIVRRQISNCELSEREPCHCPKPSDCHFQNSFTFRSIQNLPLSLFDISQNVLNPLFVVTKITCYFLPPRAKHY